MLLSKISNEALSSEEEKDVDAPTRGILSKIANSSITDVIRLSFDSISSIFQSAGVDIEKVTASRAAIDATKLLKRSNDDLLKFLIRRAKRHNSKLRFFLDEIHFAYRSQESLQQDAILVRDTIVAVQNLNDRFSEERIDIILYAAVRSEYLEHPIIASADVNHAIESVGHELTWSTFPVDRSHPLYDLVLMRFSRAVGRNMSRSEFFRTYFANIDPILFLQRTWSKPRDFVRFFKCAKTLYPDKISLRDSEFNAVWRSSAQEAWRELKSAASPFLTPEALALFEQKLATIAPAIFDKSLILNMEKLKAQMMPVYNKAKGKHENFYSFDHFIRLLYILGIFSTKRKEAGQEDIFHSYHRGNRNPHHDGEVMIHPTILKAFG